MIKTVGLALLSTFLGLAVLIDAISTDSWEYTIIIGSVVMIVGCFCSLLSLERYLK